MKIFTLYSQYIYALILFTINNRHLFPTKSEVHEYNTRNKNSLHPSLSNLTKFKNGPFIMGIKVFNHLPQFLKALVYNPKQFRTALKGSCIITHFILLRNTMSIQKIRNGYCISNLWYIFNFNVLLI